jgi:hypothetical protein
MQTEAFRMPVASSVPLAVRFFFFLLGLVTIKQETKFMTVSRDIQKEGQNKNITMDTYSFEIVKEFIYLGTLLTARNELNLGVEKLICS